METHQSQISLMCQFLQSGGLMWVEKIRKQTENSLYVSLNPETSSEQTEGGGGPCAEPSGRGLTHRFLSERACNWKTTIYTVYTFI